MSDRNLESLGKAPEFSWRRLALTLLVAAAILAVGSYLVRTYPVSGYQAGYDAVMAAGSDAVRLQVDTSGGFAQPLCAGLHARIEQRANQPHFDYDTFVAGCRAAVDELIGGRVPLTPNGS